MLSVKPQYSKVIDKLCLVFFFIETYRLEKTKSSGPTVIPLPSLSLSATFAHFLNTSTDADSTTGAWQPVPLFLRKKFP